MAYSRPIAKPRARRSILPPTLTLALWRLRQVALLQLVTGIGIVIAVLLVCTVPLYAQIVMSAGLRDTLTSDPQNADIIVHSLARKTSIQVIQKTARHVDSIFKQDLGAYLGPPQFSYQSQVIDISAITPGISGTGVYHPGADKAQIGLIGAQIKQAASHVKILQGRLPQDNAGPGTIEIAVTPETVSLLHLRVGSILTTNPTLIDGYLHVTTLTLKMKVVGIFTLSSPDDEFWHGEDFVHYSPSDFLTVYRGLASNQALLSVFNNFSSNPRYYGSVFQAGASVIWYYHIDARRLSSNNLSSLINGISNVKTDNSNNSDLEQSPYLEQSQTYLPNNNLDTYAQKIQVAQMPIVALSLLVAAMVLFFVSLMADIVVDQQISAIATLRSRGASSGQIFGSLVIQSIGLAMIALLAGPLLALPVTRFLVQHTLLPSEQGALNLINGNPLSIALSLGQYALLAVAAAIIAMIVAIARTIHLDVLSARRESARSLRHPLWQRLNLDIIIAVIALVGYGVSLYVSSANVLDEHAALLLLSPLTLLGALCLLLAALLLFLRFFPRILQASIFLAVRSRSAAPLLAVAQMARVPRQPLRMILQLALATAFAFFTLSCLASQSQRIDDIATFQTGADFSGNVPVNLINLSHLKEATTQYHSVPGVISASLGYVNPAIAGEGSQVPNIDFRAVDADTFAQTALWMGTGSSQSLSSLMQQLASQRKAAIARKLVPAIVDARAWNMLHLSQNPHFTLHFSLSDYNDLVDFVAIEQIPHIPSPNSSVGPTILADYQTFATVYKTIYEMNEDFAVPISTVWLRTHDDAASLANVRKVLSQGGLQLDGLYDRRAIVAMLHHEPLYLTLIGELALGASVALLFALVGNLIASWLSIRTRITNFTVLRALGAEPRQIVSTLAWEQCIIYITAIGLGIIIGGVFSFLVIPVLTFTSIATPLGAPANVSSGAFYIAQTVPPIQVVLPPSLGIMLVVLVALCVVALIMMISLVLRSSMSQTLRVNED